MRQSSYDATGVDTSDYGAETNVSSAAASRGKRRRLPAYRRFEVRTLASSQHALKSPAWATPRVWA